MLPKKPQAHSRSSTLTILWPPQPQALWTSAFMSPLKHTKACTVSSLKYVPPPPLPFSALLWGKSGKGVFTRILNLSRPYAPFLHSCNFNMHEVDYQSFWKNGSFIECVLRNQQHFVDTNPGGIKATCIIVITELTFPVWATKALAVASERGHSNFCGCGYKLTQRHS